MFPEKTVYRSTQPQYIPFSDKMILLSFGFHFVLPNQPVSRGGSSSPVQGSKSMHLYGQYPSGLCTSVLWLLAKLASEGSDLTMFFFALGFGQNWSPFFVLFLFGWSWRKGSCFFFEGFRWNLWLEHPDLQVVELAYLWEIRHFESSKFVNQLKSWAFAVEKWVWKAHRDYVATSSYWQLLLFRWHLEMPQDD